MVLRSFADHYTATGGKIIRDGLYDDVVASAGDTHFGAWDVPQQYASRGSPITTLGTWRPCFTADIPIVFEGPHVLYTYINASTWDNSRTVEVTGECELG